MIIPHPCLKSSYIRRKQYEQEEPKTSGHFNAEFLYGGYNIKYLNTFRQSYPPLVSTNIIEYFHSQNRCLHTTFRLATKEDIPILQKMNKVDWLYSSKADYAEVFENQNDFIILAEREGGKGNKKVVGMVHYRFMFHLSVHYQKSQPVKSTSSSQSSSYHEDGSDELNHCTTNSLSQESTCTPTSTSTPTPISRPATRRSSSRTQLAFKRCEALLNAADTHTSPPQHVGYLYALQVNGSPRSRSTSHSKSLQPEPYTGTLLFALACQHALEMGMAYMLCDATETSVDYFHKVFGMQANDQANDQANAEMTSQKERQEKRVPMQLKLQAFNYREFCNPTLCTL